MKWYDAQFSDPRHAASLLLDIINRDLQTPFAPPTTGNAAKKQQIIEDSKELIGLLHNAIDVIRTFSSSSKEAVFGAKRKGYAQTYQRAQWLSTRIAVKAGGFVWERAREVHDYTRHISEPILEGLSVVENGMLMGVAHTYPKTWRFHADDRFALERAMFWLFKDHADKQWRNNKDIRAAFEAAWMSGNLDVAKRIAKKGFG